LDKVLATLPRVHNPNVLVGFDTSDDAGVYRLTPECALVQTVDFFTPIVDDPATFGSIAAANSLSDVYAMGGTPVSALSIVCYPDDDWDDLANILQGGAGKMAEAGCAVLGGHSVRDPEIKFGYAVTGTVHPERVWTNAAAHAGDALVLTKAIGTGIISTALKRGAAKQSDVDSSVESMLQLNRDAAVALQQFQVHACTDVTGFGLLGHAREMAVGSKVTLEIDAERVPLLPGALEYARLGHIPGGLRNNREFVEPCVGVTSTTDEALLSLLYDPQTSGGLLASVPPDAARSLEESGIAIIIGSITPQQDKPLKVL
jgi:selenide,water dikinase